MEEIIKKAIEGGYEPKTYCIENPNQDERDIYTTLPSTYVLDPLFWKALGKACGWVGGMQHYDWREIALKFHGINLTEGWEKAVEYLQELIK